MRLNINQSCDGCPCLEQKDNRNFCFWYQSFVDNKDGCGNLFEEKPEHTQQQLEDLTFGENPLRKLEENNIGSLDLAVADQINNYLSGNISKKECNKLIKIRMKEIADVVRKTAKLLEILESCPEKLDEEH